MNLFDEQKKKEEEKAKEKELNDLFKIAVSQPKVPPGMCHALFFIMNYLLFWLVVVCGYVFEWNGMFVIEIGNLGRCWSKVYIMRILQGGAVYQRVQMQVLAWFECPEEGWEDWYLQW